MIRFTKVEKFEVINYRNEVTNCFKATKPDKVKCIDSFFDQTFFIPVDKKWETI